MLTFGVRQGGGVAVVRAFGLLRESKLVLDIRGLLWAYNAGGQTGF